MKQNFRLFAVSLAVLLCVCVCGFAVFANETEDTEYVGSDLPVSESYVIRALSALEARLNEKIDTIAANLSGEPLPEKPADTEPPADTEAPETEALPAETEALAAVNTAYEVICLKAGQSIVGNCELILRSGTAVALCPGANGLSDLTAGADIPGGTEISANHLLLVPRDDGRGMTVTSGEAYIMVRGTYEIK